MSSCHPSAVGKGKKKERSHSHLSARTWKKVSFLLARHQRATAAASSSVEEAPSRLMAPGYKTQCLFVCLLACVRHLGIRRRTCLFSSPLCARRRNSARRAWKSREVVVCNCRWEKFQGAAVRLRRSGDQWWNTDAVVKPRRSRFPPAFVGINRPL